VNSRVVARVIAALVAVLLIVLGGWALLSPHSFFTQLAPYRPYNKHLFHDVGAFQTGIGATLLLALFRRDALGVVLLGTSIGTALHALSHIVDRNAPGARTTDPIFITLLSAAVIVATAIHYSVRQR
jgi:hypothetical protein